MVDFGRIQKELREIASDRASGVSVEAVGDSLQRLVGSVPGPKDTPYDGGVFKVGAAGAVVLGGNVEGAEREREEGIVESAML